MYGIKQMERVCQVLYDADGSPEGTVNYRDWLDHNDYEIEFCDGFLLSRPETTRFRQ